MRKSDDLERIAGRRSARYLRAAKAAALLSSHGRVKIGCVIVNGNWKISSGYNQAKSHPRQYWANKGARRLAPQSHLHAEIDALIKSKREDLTGADVFVYREDKSGALSMCRPCSACMEALRAAGVSTVTYTTREGVKSEYVI